MFISIVLFPVMEYLWALAKKGFRHEPMPAVRHPHWPHPHLRHPAQMQTGQARQQPIQRPPQMPQRRRQ